MDKAKVKEEEYQVYFRTPRGKFVDATMGEYDWICTLIDTEPTSFFTLVINRTTGQIHVWKENRDISVVGHGFGVPIACFIANGEPLRVNTYDYRSWKLIYNKRGLYFKHIYGITKNDRIVTVEFANQPRHVIK